MQVTVFEKRVLQVRESARQRIEKAELEHLCVACLEPLVAVFGEKGEFLKWDQIRQCHPKCYHATLRAIKAGKTTEQERMTEGKFGQRGFGGPKPSNPVTKDVS